MTDTNNLSLQHRIRPANQENAPLLLLLHGYGSNEDDLFSFSPELDEGIFIVSARAPYDLPPYGAAWYAINFDAAGGKFSDLDQARKSMQLIRTFVDELKTAYDIDPENLNILGFSQGAILSYALSLSDPNLFKNVVAMSGYVNEDLVEDRAGLNARFRESENPTNYFISHGTMDQVIPFDWAKKAIPLMDEARADYVFKDYPAGHGVARDNFYDMKKWLEERI
ncbi:phospholipase [Nonlabens spongiae]|uniref:Phospholipase n=1 Tax=Nonlabens spongiae TaxID=331648 RepID=A0A1W6MN79_9FLAO|nr:dienelactone hydrolase family protein [Nonlabens spongiae]ARN79055.1 phospholipase [Nonlabens spongiae]